MAITTIDGNTHIVEIKMFLTGHYISTNEAIWRIFDLEIHSSHPSVINLAIHLENGQRVYYTESSARQIVTTPPQTTLTAYFKLCQIDSFAKTLLYQEVPTYYTWKSLEKPKMWKRHTQGKKVQGHINIRQGTAISRVYTVHPKNEECFHLRLLLHTIKGPTCFADLKTFNGELCSTYQEAC